MREYLEKCEIYLDYPFYVSHEVVRIRARNLNFYRFFYNPIFKAEPALSRQSKLVINVLLVAEVLRLKEFIFLAIYVGGRFLSFFNKKYLQALINRLNLNFKIPSRYRFFTELLDNVYNKMRVIV